MATLSCSKISLDVNASSLTLKLSLGSVVHQDFKALSVSLRLRWTSQISLKHSTVFPQVFLPLGCRPLSFPSGQPTDSFSDIIFSFAGSEHVYVCICDLISGKILTTKGRWGSELLIGALISAYLQWFQTLMPFVVQRCLSSLPPYIAVALLQASEDAGVILHLRGLSFPKKLFLIEIKWEQNFIVSATVHVWSFG